MMNKQHTQNYTISKKNIVLWLFPLFIFAIFASGLWAASTAPPSSILILDATKTADNVPDSYLDVVNRNLPTALASNGIRTVRLGNIYTSSLYTEAKRKLDRGDQDTLEANYAIAMNNLASKQDRVAAGMYIAKILGYESALLLSIEGLDRSNSVTRANISAILIRPETDSRGQVMIKNGVMTPFITDIRGIGSASPSEKVPSTMDMLDKEAILAAVKDVVGKLVGSTSVVLNTTTEPSGPIITTQKSKNKNNGTIIVLGALGAAAIVALALSGGGGSGGSSGGGGYIPPVDSGNISAIAYQVGVNQSAQTGSVELRLTSSPALSSGREILVYRDDNSRVPQFIEDKSRGLSKTLTNGGVLRGGGGRAYAEISRTGEMTASSGRNRLMSSMQPSSKAPDDFQGSYVGTIRGDGFTTRLTIVDNTSLSVGSYIYSFYDKQTGDFITYATIDVTLEDREVTNVQATMTNVTTKEISISWDAPANISGITGYQVFVYGGSLEYGEVPSRMTQTTFTAKEVSNLFTSGVRTNSATQTSITYRASSSFNVYVFVVKVLVSNASSMGPYMTSNPVIFSSGSNITDIYYSRRGSGREAVLTLEWLPAAALMNSSTPIQPDNYTYNVYHTTSASGYSGSSVITSSDLYNYFRRINDEPIKIENELFLSALFEHEAKNEVSEYVSTLTNYYVILATGSGPMSQYSSTSPYYVFKVLPQESSVLNGIVRTEIDNPNAAAPKVLISWLLYETVASEGFAVYRTQLPIDTPEFYTTTEDVTMSSNWKLVKIEDAGKYASEDAAPNFKQELVNVYAIVPISNKDNNSYYSPPYIVGFQYPIAAASGYAVTKPDSSPARIYYSVRNDDQTGFNLVRETTLNLKVTNNANQAPPVGTIVQISTNKGAFKLYDTESQSFVDSATRKSIRIKLPVSGETSFIFTGKYDEISGMVPSTTGDLGNPTFTFQNVVNGQLSGDPYPIPLITSVTLIGEARTMSFDVAAKNSGGALVNYTTSYGIQSDPSDTPTISLFDGDNAEILLIAYDAANRIVMEGSYIWFTQKYNLFSSSEISTYTYNEGTIAEYQKKVNNQGTVTGEFSMTDNTGKATANFSSTASGDYEVMAFPITRYGSITGRTALTNITTNGEGGATDAALTALNPNSFILGPGGTPLIGGTMRVRNKTHVASYWTDISNIATINTNGAAYTVNFYAKDRDGKIVMPGVPYKAEAVNSTIYNTPIVKLGTNGLVNGYYVFNNLSKTTLTVYSNNIVAWPDVSAIADGDLKAMIMTYAAPAKITFTSAGVGSTATPNIALNKLTIYPNRLFESLGHSYQWLDINNAIISDANVGTTVLDGKTVTFISGNPSLTNSVNTTATSITLPGGETVKIPQVPTTIRHIFTNTLEADAAYGILVKIDFYKRDTPDAISGTLLASAYGVTTASGVVFIGNNQIDQILANYGEAGNSGTFISIAKAISVDANNDLVEADLTYTPTQSDVLIANGNDKVTLKEVYFGNTFLANGSVTSAVYMPRNTNVTFSYRFENTALQTAIPGRVVTPNTLSYSDESFLSSLTITPQSTYTSVPSSAGANYFLNVRSGGVNGTAKFNFPDYDAIASTVTLHVGLPDPGAYTNVVSESKYDTQSPPVYQPGSTRIYWGEIDYAAGYNVRVTDGNTSVQQTFLHGTTDWVIPHNDSRFSPLLGKNCTVSIQAYTLTGGQHIDVDGDIGIETDPYFVTQLTSQSQTSKVLFPPTQPTNLTTTLNGENKLVYNWTRSEGVERYYLERAYSADGITWSYDNVLPAPGYLAADATTFTDTSFTIIEDGYYSFRLMAANNPGQAQWVRCSNMESWHVVTPTPIPTGSVTLNAFPDPVFVGDVPFALSGTYKASQAGDIKITVGNGLKFADGSTSKTLTVPAAATDTAFNLSSLGAVNVVGVIGEQPTTGSIIAEIIIAGVVRGEHKNMNIPIYSGALSIDTPIHSGLVGGTFNVIGSYTFSNPGLVAGNMVVTLSDGLKFDDSTYTKTIPIAANFASTTLNLSALLGGILVEAEASGVGKIVIELQTSNGTVIKSDTVLVSSV